MPAFPSLPLVRARDDGLQLSYQLPHRVYTAQGYPIIAPNGSSVILYGYEDGLKVVWRGGRPFAIQKALPLKETKQRSRAQDDAIMIIDSDDESMADTRKEEGSEASQGFEFEEEEPEVDPAHPFENILRQVDIPLGSRVIGLAVPPILPETARSPLDPFPPVLKKLIVVSVICTDYSTRVVTLPLTPPHPTQTDLAAWGVDTFSISGAIPHREIPRGISITFTCQENEPQQERESSRSRRASLKSDVGAGGWCLLVATHSAESSGLLVLHRIPIAEDDTVANDTGYRFCQTDIDSKQRCLPSPAQNISFNPSAYPAARHSTLLVSFHSGCVKIYSCFYTRPSKASRRSSGPPSDFETSETEGKWLISLYPGFDQVSSHYSGRRKTVIAAEWVLGGRAIMVLMADGEWGVWDVEGAGPGAAKGPLHRQSSVQGVSGGALTTFSVSGRILNPLPGPVPEHRPKFAPMTPSTKRLREDTLLKGNMTGPASPSLCGGISVYQTNSSQEALPDESILIRHGKQSAVIPSLLSLWRTAVKATGTLDASNRCRVSTIQDILLMGESLNGIGYLPAAARQARGSEQQAFEILVTAEHRILILAPKLSEPEAPPVTRASVTEPPTIEADQFRLRRGELDVDGMDRVLSGMASGNRSLRIGSPIKRARIFS